MIGVKYIGTSHDYSGYGMANRMDINALYCAGVNLTCEIIRQVPEKVDYGLPEVIVTSLVNRKIDYKSIIFHVTPDLYSSYMEDGKYHIGRLFWEVEGLPKGWDEACNKMDELWVASAKMAEMLKVSGVKVPMYHFPQAIDATRGFEKVIPYALPFEKDVVFYSIFQFINRKNAEGLLKAYWKEFEGNKNVLLIIKTYRLMYNSSEYAIIKNDILKWKGEMQLVNYPRVYIVHKLMTDSEMARFHTTSDCYVSSSSGEGWNRPAHEAMLFGKPVISGNVGGITDYLNSDMYFPVKSTISDIIPDSWHTFYQAPQKWKTLDISDLQRQMKIVYDNAVTAQKIGEKGRDFVISNFDYLTIGNRMKERLVEIEKGL